MRPAKADNGKGRNNICICILDRKLPFVSTGNRILSLTRGIIRN
jgi:hypothetical protein